MLTYLDEAIVEEHTNEARTDAGVLVHELLHLIPDDGLHSGARILVEAHLQPLARRRQRKDACCHHGEPEGSSHCIVFLLFAARGSDK
jgi:hypothetical protein